MMIRLLIIILIVLVGAAALTTLNPAADKTLNPIMRGLASVRANLDSWFSGSSAHLENAKKDPLTAAGDAIDKNVTQVYKWQDASGEWHFSSEPPPAGTKSSIETYRSDVNIVQAPPPPVEVVPEATEQPDSDIPTTAAPLLPITDPERVQQLINDAKNVQELVNNRQQNIEQHLPQ
jgi:hypothetical protein